MDKEEKRARDILLGIQKNLARFIAQFPAVHEELFKFVDATVRETALADVTQLTAGDAARLWDRARYISLSRIPHRTHEVPRCRGKVIYDEMSANAKVNEIWKQGRGKMRVYKCPLCAGHHLSHKW